MNTLPIADAARVILMRNPLNRNAVDLLRLLILLQQDQQISPGASRGHGIQKRLAAAISGAGSQEWTVEERDTLSHALLVAENNQIIRNQRLQVRVSASELKQIQANAAAAVQDVSGYVRAKLGLGDTDE